MAAILCPTRGGEGSYPTQDHAIRLAKDRGVPLIFLYISDVRFLTKGSGAVVIDLEEELDEMGKFLLIMAQERAERQGIIAERVVRHGDFLPNLLEVIGERDVSTVVLGTPTDEDRLTTEEFIRSVAEDLHSEAGVEVVLVSDGEVINRKAS